MSCAECIHYPTVSIRSELLCELLLTLLHFLLCSVVTRISLVDTYWLTFLFWIVAKVLKQQNLTSLQSSSLCVSLCAVRSKLNLCNTKSLSNSVLNLTERQLWLYLALWLTHVRHDDEGTTLLKNELKSWNCTTDTGVIGNLTILKRHIEVNTYNSLLTCEIVIVNVHFFIDF